MLTAFTSICIAVQDWEIDVHHRSTFRFSTQLLSYHVATNISTRLLLGSLLVAKFDFANIPRHNFATPHYSYSVLHCLADAFCLYPYIFLSFFLGVMTIYGVSGVDPYLGSTYCRWHIVYDTHILVFFSACFLVCFGAATEERKAILMIIGCVGRDIFRTPSSDSVGVIQGLAKKPREKKHEK